MVCGRCGRQQPFPSVEPPLTTTNQPNDHWLSNTRQLKIHAKKCIRIDDLLNSVWRVCCVRQSVCVSAHFRNVYMPHTLVHQDIKIHTFGCTNRNSMHTTLPKQKKIHRNAPFSLIVFLLLVAAFVVVVVRFFYFVSLLVFANRSVR